MQSLTQSAYFCGGGKSILAQRNTRSMHRWKNLLFFLSSEKRAKIVYRSSYAWEENSPHLLCIIIIVIASRQSKERNWQWSLISYANYILTLVTMTIFFFFFFLLHSITNTFFRFRAARVSTWKLLSRKNIRYRDSRSPFGRCHVMMGKNSAQLLSNVRLVSSTTANWG